MKTNVLQPGCWHYLARHVVAIACVLLLAPGDVLVIAQEAHGAQQIAEQTTQQTAQQTTQTAKIPPDQLDSLVAPIAIYPDQLLSQVLVASTYPLELVQLEQWLKKNPGLKDKALVDAVSKQQWDPSIQAMSALPDLVKRLTDDIQWTTDLGNAFLAQQSDVMDAVQRMRRKAQSAGALASNQQQKVETQVVDNKSVIVVEQANPQVVYVPSYDPVAVYGPAVYPYPPIYYPPYTGAAFAAGAISFGVGVAMGAAWGGGWGWGMGWGHNDIDIDMNNTFNRNTNISGTRNNVTGRNTWQHNAQHRGGAPYADRATANKFGSNARGDSLASRQRGAQQQITRQKGGLGSVGDRGAVGSRSPSGSFGSTRSNLDNRNFSSGDRIGSRNVGASSFSNRSSGFGGGSSGFSGRSAHTSSMRGSSSMGGRGFGGGGGGGGRMGGGGRRR